MVYDPHRDPLRRLAERVTAPSESGRTTFRLPPRAADALAWLTAQLRSTQKDVLAGLPDVVDDIRGTTLWESLGSVASAPPSAPAERQPAYGWRLTQGPSLSFEALPSKEPLVPSHQPRPALRQLEEPGERSTYVLPREALERLTTLSESLGVPRDEVVARALIALRAAVEVRQAGRPGVVRSLRRYVDDLAGRTREAASEAVSLPPQDPIRLHLERASSHLSDAADALRNEPDPDS